jgi:hypothetical protein
MIPGEHTLVRRTASTAVVLGGFQALSAGVLADLRTTTVAPELQGLLLPIEQRLPDDPLTDLTVVAHDAEGTAILANVGGGSGGGPGEADARQLTLWFPFDVEDSDVTFSLSWPAAGIGTCAVTIPGSDLVSGVSVSIPVSSLSV